MSSLIVKFKTLLIGILISSMLFAAGCSAAPPDILTKQNGSTNNNISAVQTSPGDSTGNQTGGNESKNSSSGSNSTSNDKSTSNSSTASGILKVHFIDVGQADSILIQDGRVNMLIDAGNNADSDTVVNYIRKAGITKLDYVIGTHPHEDHIGGLDAVIKSFDIGKIYMPKVSNTTQTYMDVLNAIKSKGLKVTNPTPGTSFKLNTAAATILAPNSGSYEDLNNYSVVVRMVFGSNSFLFTGDAEDVSESEMINKGFTLSADVLKVGHHGSNSSTTADFLSRVNPKFAVIMVGSDNSYGHPQRGTMDKLRARGIKVYRTDENGTIIATSDGKNISFNVKPGSYSYRSGAASGSNSSTSTKTTTIIPKTGATTTIASGGKLYVDAKGNGLIKGNISSTGEKIYHLPGGAYYDRTIPEAWFKTEAEAQKAGYRASKR